MKGKSKKRVIICILLLFIVLIEFIAYRMGRTKGQTSKDIIVTVSEYNINTSEKENVTMKAMYGSSGYYIVLPEIINNKIVTKYYVESSKTVKVATLSSKNDKPTAMKENGIIINKLSNLEPIGENIVNESQENTDNQITLKDTTENNQNEVTLPSVETSATPSQSPTSTQTPSSLPSAETSPDIETTPKNEVLPSGQNNENEEITNEVKTIEADESENTTTSPTPENTTSDPGKDETLPSDVIDEQKEEPKEEQKEDKIVELLPGQTINISDDEIKEGKINLNVQYDSKIKNDLVLYNQVIELKDDNSNIEVKGYMPNKAEIKIEPVKNEVIENVASELEENTIIEQLFTLKILVDGKEYDSRKYNEKIKVKLKVENKQEDYKILEVKNSSQTGYLNNEDSSIAKLSNVEKSKNIDKLVIRDENNSILKNEKSSIKIEKLANGDSSSSDITEYDIIRGDDFVEFETYSLTTLALVQTQATTGTVTETIEAVVTTGAPWDGSVATSFSGGDGTQSKPYLILDGSELAYLRSQVNNGNTYDGKYFQLVGDIDLNNRAWTPIGVNTNNGRTTTTFQGIFDGAGHSISNCTITCYTGSLSNGVIYNTGIFGAIQGNSGIAEIKNTEFNNISIRMTNSLSGTTSSAEFHIGIVTGTMYQKSKIKNVIVNNGKVEATNDITLDSYNFVVSVGGITGEARATETSINDPGAGNRYSIENCYVSLTTNTEKIRADLLLVGASSTTAGSIDFIENVIQLSTGGIIGRIRSQDVYPINCMVKVDLTAHGFVGPIFGSKITGAISNYSTNNDNNLKATVDTLWNGNINGTTMNSYFQGCSISGTGFNSASNTVTSGNSTKKVASNFTTGLLILKTYYRGYLQGVNKGRYLNNTTTMLNNFNNYNSGENIDFEYTNNKFSLKRRITAGILDNGDLTYTATVEDPYQQTPYTYNWYIDGELDTQRTTETQRIENESFSDMLPVKIIISDNSGYYGVAKFAVPKLYIKLDLEVDYTDASNFKINGTLSGTGTLSSIFNINDYTFEWYHIDLAGINSEKIEGVNSLTLEHVEDGEEYKLVATNSRDSRLSAQNSIIVGNRNVVYVAYSSGRDTRLGDTPQTSVETLSRAYDLLTETNPRSKNVIVIMENYTTNSIYNSESSTTYDKNATITGAYNGIRYSPQMYMNGEANNYRYLCGDTTFQYMTWYGGNTQLYLYVQGFDLTMGEEMEMDSYAAANQNQGLTSGSAPAVHIFGGWCQYNLSHLPSNELDGTRKKAEILIKSGVYGRVLGGGSSGTSSASNLNKTTSHNFVGTDLTTDSYDIEITVDIKNSTKGTYTYDINLLGGGATSGNTYGNATVNIKNGSVGRVLGGSIGNSANVPSNWSWPINTYIGTATINMSGGTVNEFYGGSLGRNMSAIGSGASSNQRLSDTYFYGKIYINISAGTVSSNIYGAGAGGVTGYSTLSSDPYKETYGKGHDTEVNINISGGTIQSNVYGGGYGYTNYLTEGTTTNDGGALYGNSNISISGSPTISGNIYGAGCGYKWSNDTSKTELAKMYGTATIAVNGTPTITGTIFGAGAGISGLPEMAKLVGNSIISLNAGLTADVYGGGNIAKLEGTSEMHINSGTHSGNIFGGGKHGQLIGSTYVEVNGTTNSGNIYGGGDEAEVSVATVVDIKGGTNTGRIFGGGNQAKVTKSTVNIKGGTNSNVFACGNAATSDDPAVNITGGTSTNVYGGGNQTDVNNTKVFLENGGTAVNIFGGSNSSGTVTTSHITANGGTATTIYGGNNAGGTVTDSYIEVNGGTITNVFGGNNAADNTTISSTNVDINSSVTNVYGGNNLKGNATQTNVNINDGTISNVFGGGNEANADTSNIAIIAGNVTNVYGGGNKAGINTLANINATGGIITNIYGGSNEAGTVTKSNVQVNYPNPPGEGISYNVTNVYGGNNQGGITQDANVTITKAQIDNIFGGGNKATTTNTTVKILDGTINNAYGGGNQKNVSQDTNIEITGGTINKNLYGGGNEGAVDRNSNAKVKNATVKGNAYGGGNGETALVVGNSTLTIEGNAIIGYSECDLPKEGSVFGGGNAAKTGIDDNTSSISKLNVTGGTIYGNTYGGANTAKVNGKAVSNIGIEAVGDNTLTKGDIHIYGTTFGGGEANEAGEETFDWDAIYVTNGVDVTIDAKGYDNFLIDKSIFGSGNASSSAGTSTVRVKNYGTITNPKYNVSIQRTNIFILENSAIALDGAADRANEYASTAFSISRIDDLRLTNNSTLYMNNGANLLKKYSSLKVDQNGNETLEKVEIDDTTGEILSQNVDNRIYLLEGKNLNIALNENVTSYGEVNGMTFLGLYTGLANPSGSSAYYAPNYHNGSSIENSKVFSLNSYVLGAHKNNHNIKKDGFYTNKNNENVVKCEYVGVTPEDDTYYMWIVGDAEDITIYNITLTASKFATLGTVELPLTGFSTPNTKFDIENYTVSMRDGINLIDHNEIKTIAENSNEANTKFGLNMKNGKNGWITDNENNFFSDQNSTYTGTKLYQTENTTVTPSLLFCLYHSENISVEQSVGSAKIRFLVLIPESEISYQIAHAEVIITMNTKIFKDNFYEAAITPGEEFSLFTTTETNINDKSKFSTYYSLYIPKFSTDEIYNNYQTDYRCLVSTEPTDKENEYREFMLPVNTRITMLDLVTKETFYYVVTQEDVNNNKTIIPFTDFNVMGSTGEKYNPSSSYNKYYDSQKDILYESFIFHVDYGQTNISEDLYDKRLSMELRRQEEDEDGVRAYTVVGILGIQRDSTKYSVYKDQEAVITAQSQISPETSYLGKDISLTAKTNFRQNIIGSKIIYDTTFFNQKLGLKISIYDSDGNLQNIDTLMGIYFELDGNRYYPRIDGSTRIKVADRVSNVLSRITINTSQNQILPTGRYTLKIETFGSPDGVYYGIEASDYTECSVYIINGTYGLKVVTTDKEKIINKDTGNNQNNTNTIKCNISYDSSLENPVMTVSLYRRDYGTIYSNGYNKVDLADFVIGELNGVDFAEKEYLVTDNLTETMSYNLAFKENLMTGTYKIVFRLYDDTTYIGEAYEYIIIR